MMTATTLMPLDQINIAGGTQSRTVIDQTLVYQYIECIKNGDEFPEIETVFDGSTHWLVDGFHRYHAYKLMGLKQVDVIYKPGTQAEAQIRSFGVNSTHGKSRTNEDKRHAVKLAMEHPDLQGASDRAIADICKVSAPFVGGVRNPEVKKRQAKNVAKHFANKESEQNESVIKLHPAPEAPVATPPPVNDFGPSEEELKANEIAMQADMEMLNKLLESDEPLKIAHEEIVRLNLRYAQLEVRFHGLMNEKNEAIKIAKRAQAQIDRQGKSNRLVNPHSGHM